MYKKIEEILANGKVRGIIVGDSLTLVRLYVFARCRHVGVLEKGVKNETLYKNFVFYRSIDVVLGECIGSKNSLV